MKTIHKMSFKKKRKKGRSAILIQEIPIVEELSTIQSVNNKIHIIFIDEDGNFIPSRDKHIRFVYLD